MKNNIFNTSIIIMLFVLLISCKDKELKKLEIVGSYGQKGDWYFQFDTSLNISSYLKDPKTISNSLKELDDEKSSFDGIVYMEKSTGEAGLGLWKLNKISDWGGTEVNIKWQKYGFTNQSLYTDGSWYFKKDGNLIYFTASEVDFNTKIASWPKGGIIN